MLSLPLLLSLRSPWMAAIGETAKSKGQGVEFLAYNTKSVIIFDLFWLEQTLSFSAWVFNASIE